MSYNYNTPYAEHSNRILDWFNTDSKKQYDKNLIEKYDLLSKHKWIDKNFTYQFNSLGFRCNEFTNNLAIMFLGCSFTFGIGLPLETIFPEIVSKNLNLSCANLGVPAGSSDCAFRLCHGYIDKINPKIVIFMTPPHIRFELVRKSTILQMTEHSFSWISNKIYRDIFLEWAVDDNNDYFNHHKNLLAIEALCTKRNIKFINIDSSMLSTDSLARDLMHPGIESHQKVANHILSLI